MSTAYTVDICQCNQRGLPHGCTLPRERVQRSPPEGKAQAPLLLE